MFVDLSPDAFPKMTEGFEACKLELQPVIQLTDLRPPLWKQQNKHRDSFEIKYTFLTCVCQGLMNVFEKNMNI